VVERLTFSELEVSRALVASLMAKSRISSSMKHSLIVGFPRLILFYCLYNLNKIIIFQKTNIIVTLFKSLLILKS
jgi:hypothetical protein